MKNSNHVVLLPNGEIYGFYPRSDGSRIAGAATRLMHDRSLLHIIDQAHKYKWSHVWLYRTWEQPEPDVLRSELDKAKIAGFNLLATWERTEEQEKAFGGNTLRTIYGWKEEQGKYNQDFSIVYLESGEDKRTWPFYSPEAKPEQFLNYIDKLERKLKRPIGATPASTGIDELEAAYAGKKDAYVLEPPSNIHPVNNIFQFERQKPPIFQRQPTREELNEEYVVVGDQNSSFPNGAKNVKFGTGDVIRLTSNIEFDHLTPGLWKVKLLEPRWNGPPENEEVQHARQMFDSGFVPLPYKNMGIDHDYYWLNTSLVKGMKRYGFNFTIEEAHIFDKEQARYIYRPVVNKLWKLRSEEDEEIMRETYKKIMNNLFGVVRSTKIVTKYTRADHNNEIVGESRWLVLWQILRIARLTGKIPVLVVTDALVYICGKEGIPKLFEHEKVLGGYKQQYKIKLTEELKTVLMQPPSVLSVAKKMEYIKYCARKEAENGIS